MKKHVIAAAIAAAVAAPAAMAGAPTVYGQINMSVDSIDTKANGAAGATYTTNATATTLKDKAASGIFVSSNSSRIGVKGSEDLGNGLKAIYKIEFGVPVDDTTKASKGGDPITSRNAYVGLAGGFGAVLLGRHDTPMKMAQPTDLFNDGYGDLIPFSGGLGYKGKGGDLRSGNVLAYVSPSFSGVKLVAAVVPNEGGNLDAANNPKESGLTDVYSIAAMYGSKKKGLYLSAAYNGFSADAVMGASGGRVHKSASETRLSAQYAVGALVANVMYQNFDVSGVDAMLEGTWIDGENWQANLGYTIGAATLKAKYSSVNYKRAGMKDGSAYGLGVDYALGKKTTAYVEYVSSDNFTLVKTDGTNNNAGETNAQTSAISIGLLHKF